MRKVIFISVILSCSFYSCIKAPSYSIIPHIEFVSVSSNYVYAFPNGSGGVLNPTDTITFSFTDGDGDIGINSTDTDTSHLCGLQTGDSSILHSPVFNVFLIDTRTNCVTPFRSANVPPPGKYKGISGNILVITQVTSNKCIVPMPTCPNDTVIFGIVIHDMAGHLSNIIQTTPIIINSQQ
jgi:hypothetical protein